MLRFVFAALAFFPGLAGSALACTAAQYAGEATPDGQPAFAVVISIQCKGGDVSGQVESRFGTNPIVSGTSSDDVFHLEVDQGDQRLVLDARRSDQAWTGTFVAGRRSGALALKRDAAATLATLTAAPPERTDLTTEQWIEDLAFIEREIPLKHLNAFHSLSKDAWRDAVQAVRDRLPSLNNAEIPVALRQLVARIGDAHTSLRLPTQVERLPIGMFWFGDELRIVSATGAYENLLGATIIGIGSEPIGEVQRRTVTLIPPENRWAQVAFAPYLMRRKDVLDFFGLTDAGGGVRFDLRMSDGRTLSANVVLGPEPDADAWRYIGGRPPLWAQGPSEPLFWRKLDGNVLYINFRGYETLSRRSQELVAEIDRMRPARVIIDMRDNGGGDFQLFRRNLLPSIIERPWLNRAERLYVLIGREMFSAAMTNAADLASQTNATLVGEPIGERPNSYQEVASFFLPNSHLKLGVSIAFYEALPGQGDPDAVMPDLACPPTWPVFAEGRDDALECALGH